MASNHCTGLATDLVTRAHLGQPEWVLRGRVLAPSSGASSAFGGPHSLTFNRPFWEQLDRWARNTEWWTTTYPSSVGPRRIAWFGEVGTLACHRPTAAHNRARGLDLCQIRFTDGTYVDMNASHGMNRLHQRRYLAVAANLRRYFGTVLTRHYNRAHRDHIHVDDLTAVAPIRADRRTDTTLIQSAANLLNGESLAIDGIWGPRTDTAHRRLLRAFGLECTRTTESVSHARSYLAFIVATAISDRDAGAYRSRACRPKDPCRQPDDALTQLGCDTEDLLAGLGGSGSGG